MENARSQVLWWGFYDFANSLAYSAVSFYFALWFIENAGGKEYWIGIAVAVVTLLLLSTLPRIGRWIDRNHKQVACLALFSLLSILSLTVLFGVTWRTTMLSSGTTLAILICYGAFQYFYQASIGVYT